MKIKQLLSFFCSILAISMVVVACGDDDSTDEPTVDPPTFTMQELSVKLKNSDARIHKCTFMAIDNWKATSNADWCTPLQEKGAAADIQTIELKIAENISSEERTCNVIFQTQSNSTTFATITITQPGHGEINANDENANAPAGMRKNAAYLVKQIDVGWNLGNTCECGIWDGWSGDDVSIETNWGNPKTTLEMITALHDAGFNAIRIPTRWYVHADGNMNINDRWMNRIKEIVDYAVSQNMYVILNSHHDSWYDRLPVGYNEAEINARFEKMWTQIANAFRDYDEHLIFAGANEIIKLKNDGSEDWGTPTAANIKFANNLMQTFVNTVRATGGNNEWRCLMVQPWAANPSNALNNAFAMPTDKVENRLILEYHCYDPYNYAIGKDQKGNKRAQHEFTDNDRNDVSKLFARINQKFVAQGTPVIMAEFGSTQDNSYSGGHAAADVIRANYHTFIVSEAKQYNIPGFYWDNGAFTGDGENFGLLNRKTCAFPSRAKTALKGIMDGLQSSNND